MEQSALFQMKNSGSFSVKKIQLIGKKICEVSGPVLFIVILFCKLFVYGMVGGFACAAKQKYVLIMEPKYLKKSDLGVIQNFLPTFVFRLIIWGEKNYFLLSLGECYFDFLYVWSDNCGLNCISG